MPKSTISKLKENRQKEKEKEKESLKTTTKKKTKSNRDDLRKRITSMLNNKFKNRSFQHLHSVKYEPPFFNMNQEIRQTILHSVYLSSYEKNVFDHYFNKDIIQRITSLSLFYDINVNTQRFFVIDINDMCTFVKNYYKNDLVQNESSSDLKILSKQNDFKKMMFEENGEMLLQKKVEMMNQIIFCFDAIFFQYLKSKIDVNDNIKMIYIILKKTGGNQFTENDYPFLLVLHNIIVYYCKKYDIIAKENTSVEQEWEKLFAKFEKQ